MLINQYFDNYITIIIFKIYTNSAKSKGKGESGYTCRKHCWYKDTPEFQKKNEHTMYFRIHKGVHFYKPEASNFLDLALYTIFTNMLIINNKQKN